MEPKEYVVMLLKNHSRIVREAASLRFELKNFVKVGDDEIIEEMALSHQMGDGIRSGCISNKTADVALRYREVADRVNEEAYKAVVRRLIALETAINRLDFYMSLLDETQAEVLRKYYFDRCIWRDLQEDMQLTMKTMRKIRDDGIVALTERYAMLFPLSVITTEELELFCRENRIPQEVPCIYPRITLELPQVYPQFTLKFPPLGYCFFLRFEE